MNNDFFWMTMRSLDREQIYDIMLPYALHSDITEREEKLLRDITEALNSQLELDIKYEEERKNVWKKKTGFLQRIFWPNG